MSPAFHRGLSGFSCYFVTDRLSAFSALTLLVWCQEELPACKNWVMGCWCGYLSAAKCRLFAYFVTTNFLPAGRRGPLASRGPYARAYRAYRLMRPCCSHLFIHCVSVHQAAKLVAALLRVASKDLWKSVLRGQLRAWQKVKAAYRRVYDSRRPQADCQEPGLAPEPYAR